MSEPPDIRLIRSVEALISRGGLPAASTDAVIADSGVARRTLYTRFGSKEALIVEALHRRDDQLMEAFEAAAAAAGPGFDDRLSAVFNVLRNWFLSPDFNGCLFVKAASASEAGDPIHAAAVRHKDRMGLFLERELTLARFQDAEAKARCLLVLIEGATIMATYGDRRACADDALGMALTLVVKDHVSS